MLSQILHDDLYNMVVNVTSQNDTQYLLELAHFKDANDASKFAAVSTRTIYESNCRIVNFFLEHLFSPGK